MKKHLLLIVLIFTGFALWAQTSTAPTVGDGSAGNPYQIATLANLYWLSQTSAKWDSNFIQTADIDASATSSWNSGAGWSSPIGDSTTNFGGHYNGNGHVISSLTINNPTVTVTYVGLFGYSSGTIDSLGVSQVNLTDTATNNSAGGLVGLNNGIIRNCYSTGSVSDTSGTNAGGLVGENEDTITNCYSAASVLGNSAGGLVGMGNNGSIQKCYTTGSISGNNAGGLVGYAFGGSYTDCYTTSSVFGNSYAPSPYAGGLVGLAANGLFKYCYATGSVSLSSSSSGGYAGGLAGYSGMSKSVTVYDSLCFWNTDAIAAGIGHGTAGGNYTGETTHSLQMELTFTNAGWDFQDETANGTADIWGINPSVNGGFPFLSWTGYTSYTSIPSGSGTFSDPYQIANLRDLYWLSQIDSVWSSGHYFIQTADIDADSTLNWNSGAGFSPIGNSTTLFQGIYNGGSHTIDSLYINDSIDSYVGLFGNTDQDTLRNIGLLNCNIINGEVYGTTGALAGYNSLGPVENCFASGGSVTSSEGEYVGGLVGESDCAISNSYATVTVNDTSGWYIGGLVGYTNGQMISNSYAAGNVNASGSYYVGGLVGMDNNDTISKSYATGNVNDTSGEDVGGLVGETDGSINNSYTTGNVNASGSSYVGGLVGEISTNYPITNTYATGKVSGSNYVGGLSGYEDYSPDVSGSFWDKQTSGQTTSVRGTGETTTEMQTLSTYTDSTWDFTNIWAMNGSVNSGYPYLLWQHPYSWTGTTSGAWKTASNWYSDTVPSTQDVYINRSAVNFPVVDSGTNALSNKIVVDSSATLTVAAGGGLTVSDSVINNGTFTLASDSTSDGSLIVDSAIGGTGTYIRQQYIPDNDTWHTIASPSQNDTIVGSDFVPSAPLPGDFDFYSYDQSLASPWVNINSGGSVNSSFETDFIPGKGYLVAYTLKYGKNTFDFKGPFNTGDVTPPALAYTSGAKHAGSNLLGNPYTSAIDWSKATLSDFSDNYAYVYDPNKSGGPGYDDINGGTSGAYIAPGQAFFVYVTATPSTPFKFTSSMQVNEPTVTLKSAEATQGSNELVLRLSSKSHYDQTTLQVIDGTKSTRDRDDALELLSLDDSIPQIYSCTSDSVPVAINSYPSIDSIFTVQLGTYIPFQGTYTISLQQDDGVFSGQSIDLEDLSNGTTTNLTNGSYTFNGNKSDVRRFVLTINGTTGINKTSVSSGIQVYGYHSSIYIQTRGGSNLNGEVTVYNLMGEVVYHSTLNDTPSQVLNLQTGNGMYVVELNLKSGKRIVNKVLLEQ